MKKDAIIFDLYGVLGLNGWQAFKARHFSNRPEAWERLRRLGQRADAGLAAQHEFVQALVRETGETAASVRREFEQTRANEPLLQFIAEELKPLYKIGLLSNTSHDVFQTIFSPGQLALFDAMIGSFSVGITKPDPRMFTTMCEQLGTAPEQCVMVDDMPHHLAAAAALGMSTVQYTSVDQTIRDIREVLACD
ncbi:hypothetical protein CSA80_04510 [Candidatus Saccharibacteria bacterium]|nr:MAG: hypothetical protein CR973_01415 [Candidatus Saccharibacteria bacterium]PID98930.1 MAG: hypothetical protein CSA80_04510 [Candidatus Saccharibacteria bacterium]